jgi:hypothetical protein
MLMCNGEFHPLGVLGRPVVTTVAFAGGAPVAAGIAPDLVVALVIACFAVLGLVIAIVTLARRRPRVYDEVDQELSASALPVSADDVLIQPAAAAAIARPRVMRDVTAAGAISNTNTELDSDRPTEYMSEYAACLEIAPDRVRPIGLRDRPQLIGRSPDGPDGIPIAHPDLAPEHARIDLYGGRIYIADLGSPSGTRVNLRRLQPGQRREIAPGDVITLGDDACVMRVLSAALLVRSASIANDGRTGGNA